MNDHMARDNLNDHLYYLMTELFGDDYLEEDNQQLQIKRSNETHETLQRLDIQRPTKTIEERKKEAECLRMRKAQITQYSLEPTLIIPDTVKLVRKENQPATQVVTTTSEDETDHRDTGLEIHLDDTEQSAIEETISVDAKEKPLSNRAKKKRKWVANIGKIRKQE